MSSVHTLGVPIRSVNWVRIFPVLDAEGRDCLVAVMGQQADGFMVVKVDPVTEQFGSYRDIAEEASCWSLAWLSRQDLLAVGTTINGGSGTRPRVSQAVLFLWDYEREEKVWEGTLDRHISAINALVVGEDGLLYGTALGDEGSVLFAFDPVSRAFHYAIPLDGRPLDLGLQNGPDGKIYGFTTASFYAFDPAHRAITPLYEEEDAFQIPGPVMGNNVYFAKKHEVKRLVI